MDTPTGKVPKSFLEEKRRENIYLQKLRLDLGKMIEVNADTHRIREEIRELTNKLEGKKVIIDGFARGTMSNKTDIEKEICDEDNKIKKKEHERDESKDPEVKKKLNAEIVNELQMILGKWEMWRAFDAPTAPD
jgi:hypothetical protein